MPSILRIYTGDDGQSHIEQMPLSMQPFLDTEGAHGEGTSLPHVQGITFRVSPPRLRAQLALRAPAAVFHLLSGGSRN